MAITRPTLVRSHTATRRQLRQQLRRLAVGWRSMVTTSTGRLAALPVILAAQPTFSASGDGMPGNTFVSTLLSWIAYLALGGCLASIMAGGGAWAWGHHTGNARGASMGKNFVVGGAVGAAFVGMAPTIVTLFQQAGAS